VIARRAAIPALLGVAVVAGAGAAAAQPYRWVDEQGAVHYTDRPPQQRDAPVENMNPAARRRAADDANPPVARPAEPARAESAAAPAARAPRSTAPPATATPATPPSLRSAPPAQDAAAGAGPPRSAETPPAAVTPPAARRERPSPSPEKTPRAVGPRRSSTSPPPTTTSPAAGPAPAGDTPRAPAEPRASAAPSAAATRPATGQARAAPTAPGTPGSGLPAPPAPTAEPPSEAARARRAAPTDADPPASPPDTPPDDEAAAPVHDLMRLSGMDRRLGLLVALARNEFRNARRRLTDPEAVWKAVARGFNRDEMAPVAARCLLTRLTPEERERALEWLRSPLFRRLARLRDDVLGPARRRQYRQFVARLPDDPPPPSRIALARALEEQTRAGLFQLQVQRAVTGAIATVLEPLTGRARPAAPGAGDGNAAAEDDAMRFYGVTMILFAYGALSDAELEEVIRVTGSPDGARFTEVYQDCVRAAIAAGRERAAIEIRRLAAAARRAG